MRKSFFLVLMQLLMLPIGAEDLTSPNGKYVFHFSQKDARMWYSVGYNGKTVIEECEMGINLDNHLFESALGIPNDGLSFWGENLQLRNVDTFKNDTTWIPLYGENHAIRDHYNAMVLHLVKGNIDKDTPTAGYDKRSFYFMDVEVRAYDEGIAFRYVFPEQSNGLFLNITGERTQFRFPEGTLAFFEPWAQGPFSCRSLHDWPDESERPLLLKLPNGLKVALLEARMVDYARGKFRLAGDNLLQVSMYDGVEVMSPYQTPWRVIMVGERSVDLINHKDLVLNLNEPCRLEDVSYVRPGKAYRCGKLERDAIMEGIRFAEKMQFDYVELDAGWYGPEQYMSSNALKEASNRNFTIKEVCDSARVHGLGVWVYVNQRALYYQLDQLLPLYRQWGVKGIKFGFVQIGNQMWTTWLHDAVRKCGENGFMVDIHDEYRPTGVSRTYPNLLTQEGIGGNEEMPDAVHNTILPFTRFLCGPADYTLCYYNGRVKNTKAHQLAMATVYYSPLQFMFWYDGAELYHGEAELKFWQDIPTVFDESIALDGEPGEYIIQARRSGTDWFVGAMTNTEARTVNIRTADFLSPGKYTVEIYNDDPSLSTRTKVAAQTLTVKAGKVLDLSLQPSGGAALHFVRLK